MGPNNRRSVRVEVEVQGTVYEVWDAIATGPGISSWFVPTTIDCAADGNPTGLVCDFGPGMISTVELTRWDPPLGFSANSQDFVPNGPDVVTDWTVEPVGDVACLVRVEHNMIADTDEYDVVLEATESGWPAFFRILQLYLSDFPGQRCGLLEVLGMAPDPESAWPVLSNALGLSGAAAGDRVASPEGAPALVGFVDSVISDNEVILNLERPAPGVGHMFSMPMDDATLLSLRLYLYGEDSDRTAESDLQSWRSWMAERFTLLD